LHFGTSGGGLCVFIVVVVMTVMRGLVTDFKQKNHRFVGDCVVASRSLVGFAHYQQFMDILEKQDFVEAVSPVIHSYALVTTAGSEQGVGVEIMGIDPVLHSEVTGFAETLYYHRGDPNEAFRYSPKQNAYGCVLGINLVISPDARGRYHHTLRPYPTVLVVSCFPLTARGALARAGTALVSSKQFYYGDTSESGLARVDTSMVYLPFEQAQLLCGMADGEKRVSSLHIRFRPGTATQAGCRMVSALWRDFVQSRKDAPLANLFGMVAVQSWKENRREFIAAMEKEQTMLIMMFALVGVTTVFIIFVVFFMIVSHKSKDIGILKSVGVSNASLAGLFLLFAVEVGIFGSLAGAVLAWVFLEKINAIESWLFEHFRFQLWDRTIYAIGQIPNRLEVAVLATIVAAAVAACLVGALAPTVRAAKMQAVETLRVSQL